jgi:ABC-type multidrug transport system ATPase subunit
LGSLSDLHFSEVSGRKLLILGDVGSGKTALTARMISEAVSSNTETNVTVIDMAPERRKFKDVLIGGRIIDSVTAKTNVRLLVPTRRLHAPRMEGRTATEIINFARTNAELIEELLESFLVSPTPILFINDASIYLQGGETRRLLKTVRATETFVANAYQGTTLLDDRHSGISKRERLALNALKNAMDRVIVLRAKPTPTIQNTIMRRQV